MNGNKNHEIHNKIMRLGSPDVTTDKMMGTNPGFVMVVKDQGHNPLAQLTKGVLTVNGMGTYTGAYSYTITQTNFDSPLHE